MNTRNREKINARLLLILGVVAYIFAILFSYEKWVVPRYENWGMSYRDVPIGYIVISWMLCLISAIWIPRDLTRPSQLLFLIQYIVIFIPTSFILYHSVRPELPPEEVLVIILALFLGLTILQASYKIPLLKIKHRVFPAKFFWSFFWCGSIGLFIYLLMIFGGFFNLANFQDMYDVRSEADKIVETAGSSFAGYSKMWLSGFFLPFLFSVGIFRKRWSFVILSAIGYFYLLGVTGTKSTMFAIIYLSAIYFLVRSGGKNVGIKILIFFSMLLILPIIFMIIGKEETLIDTWYVAIVHSRTFTIPQLSIGQYYNFFENHPLTYGSHVTGINLFVTYPYDMDIPRTIGRYFYDAELTANVNMWAQDGIASFGLIGIPIISAIVALIFLVFDSIAKPHDTRFVAVLLGNIAMTYANGSIFTTMISGGLLLLILALYIYPVEYFRNNNRKIF